MIAASLVLASLASRDVVSFDFGWKHRTGLHDWAKPDDQPPVSPDPGSKPAEAQPSYPDSGWKDVQLPHDGLIGAAPSTTACPDGCSGKSYIPRHVLWYRKQFNIPSDWAGSAFWLDFEGSFRTTTVWINGLLAGYHNCGYTPFRVRLDNITTVKVGTQNTIAVFVDPDNGDTGSRDHGSGWWYEGGGLYRHVSLVRASTVHVAQDGLFAYSNITSAVNGATTGLVHASAEVFNSGASSSDICVSFELTAPDGSAAGRSFANWSIPAGGSVIASGAISVSTPQLWSAATPWLYTVAASIHTNGACGTAAIDSVSAAHGFRSLRYDANQGFFLNDAHFKVSIESEA